MPEGRHCIVVSFLPNVVHVLSSQLSSDPRIKGLFGLISKSEYGSLSRISLFSVAATCYCMPANLPPQTTRK